MGDEEEGSGSTGPQSYEGHEEGDEEEGGGTGTEGHESHEEGDEEEGSSTGTEGHESHEESDEEEGSGPGTEGHESDEEGDEEEGSSPGSQSHEGDEVKVSCAVRGPVALEHSVVPAVATVALVAAYGLMPSGGGYVWCEEGTVGGVPSSRRAG